MIRWPDAVYSGLSIVIRRRRRVCMSHFQQPWQQNCRLCTSTAKKTNIPEPMGDGMQIDFSVTIFASSTLAYLPNHWIICIGKRSNDQPRFSHCASLSSFIHIFLFCNFCFYLAFCVFGCACTSSQHAWSVTLKIMNNEIARLILQTHISVRCAKAFRRRHFCAAAYHSLHIVHFDSILNNRAEFTKLNLVLFLIISFLAVVGFFLSISCLHCVCLWFGESISHSAPGHANCMHWNTIVLEKCLARIAQCSSRPRRWQRQAYKGGQQTIWSRLVCGKP